VVLQILNPEFIKAKKHFEAWRANRANRSSIPDHLWKLAVSHIPRYGLNRVSREFQVNYTKLKEKAQQLGLEGQKPESIEPCFVELAFPKETLGPPHPAARIRLVLERGDGSRLCLEGDRPDLSFMEKVIRSFYSR
jgi:hypothetical protein